MPCACSAHVAANISHIKWLHRHLGLFNQYNNMTFICVHFYFILLALQSFCLYIWKQTFSSKLYILQSYNWWFWQESLSESSDVLFHIACIHAFYLAFRYKIGYFYKWLRMNSNISEISDCCHWYITTKLTKQANHPSYALHPIWNQSAISKYNLLPLQIQDW